MAGVTAYESLIAAHEWPHLRRYGRVAVYAPYTTGTVTFDADAGTLTLSDGTWPTWAATGVVSVSGVEAGVKARTSGTVLQISDETPWPDDFEDQSYSISPLYYQLPDDFERTMGPVSETWGYGAVNVTLDEILRHRRMNMTTGTPCFFAVAGHPTEMNRKVLYVYPYPSNDETLDFAYEAKVRAIRFDGDEVISSGGTMSVSLGGTTVTGSSTTWTDDLVGGVLRIGTASTRPAGSYSENAAVEELVVESVESTTQLTLATAASAAASGVKYTISDPFDLPVPAREALLRHAELELGIAAGMKSIDLLQRRADTALMRAMAATSTYQLGGRRTQVSPKPADIINITSSGS